MSFDLTVHHYLKTSDGKPPRLDKVTPYAKLMNGHDMTVYLRQGKCFSGDGSLIDPIPEWVYEQIRSMKVKGDYYGIVLPEDQPKAPQGPRSKST